MDVVYFDKAGRENTDKCIDIAEKNIGKYKDVVVATTTGETGLMAAKRFGKKANVVVVTHSSGFKGENVEEISDAKRKEIEAAGGKLFTGTILTCSIERSFADKYSGYGMSTVVADTLRLLGQGMKVCVEIVLEACDAGMIEEGKDVLAVAGTGRGADTVCVIKSAVSRRFHSLKVREILAKPRDF